MKKSMINDLNIFLKFIVSGFRYIALTLYVVTCVMFFPDHALSVENPSAAYCNALGYTYVTEKEGYGNEVGVCIFPDNSRAGSWDFLRGKAGSKFSYCSRMGYETESRFEAKNGFKTEYGVCLIPVEKEKGNTLEIPVIELMQKNGDLTTENQRLESKATGKNDAKTTYFKSNTDTKVLPTSFDWRYIDGKSYIGPIRDQGSCGSCYAFSAAAAAEGVYNYANGLYDGACADFSEAFIAFCLGTYGPYSYHFDGCYGADYEYAELTALTNEGVTWEENFPYIETDPGSCTHWNDPVVVFTSWERITSNDIEGIKSAIMTYGAIDVAVWVDTAFSNYTGGIYEDSLTDCPYGPYTTSNHGVSLVGWGNDTTYGDYWILRNSWGSEWGENGYMRIQAQSARVACSAATLTYLPPGTEFSLKVMKKGSGSGTVSSIPSGIDCGSECVESYEPGTEVKLYAYASYDSTFSGWGGDCDSNGLVEINSDKSCTATFSLSGPTPEGTLEEALDNTDFVWTTGGDAEWFSQTEEFYYGSAAAQSGNIDHDQTTWLETHVTGPGLLSFYWKVSSEEGFDYLRFYNDGAEQEGISGEVDWEKKEIAIQDGNHTITWAYTKDFNVDRGEDTALVDWVVYIPNGVMNYSLTASSSGSGDGTVFSNPAGIVCGANCTAVYEAGTVVTLESVPSGESVFTGWMGDCDGGGNVTIDKDKACAAIFTAGLDSWPYTVELPKTGQETVYSKGDDASIKGGVNLPSPRFNDNEDGTVTDKLTGLIWLKNANCFGGESWTSALSSVNSLKNGECGLSDGSVSGDWRLPNVREMASIVNRSYYNPAISNLNGLSGWSEEDIFTDIQSSVYWTSTTNAYNPDFAWSLNMRYGDQNWLFKDLDNYVWPVKGGGAESVGEGDILLPRTGQGTIYAYGDDGQSLAGIALPKPRFSNNNDGTVTDNLSGLIWLKNANCSETERTWLQALSDIIELNKNGTMNGKSCGDMSNSGSHDTTWRLPNVNELWSIIDFAYSDPAVSNIDGSSKWSEGDIFTGLLSNSYWSSTTNTSSSVSGWYVNYWNGLAGFSSKDNGLYVWPVKGGKTGGSIVYEDNILFMIIPIIVENSSK